MDYGCRIYAVLRDLYAVIFPVPTYDTATPPVAGVVILYNNKLCAVHDCVWHSWTWRNDGQLAVQYHYSGRTDDCVGSVGDFIYARTLHRNITGLGSCTRFRAGGVICGYEDKCSFVFS